MDIDLRPNAWNVTIKAGMQRPLRCSKLLPNKSIAASSKSGRYAGIDPVLEPITSLPTSFFVKMPFCVSVRLVGLGRQSESSKVVSRNLGSLNTPSQITESKCSGLVDEFRTFAA